MAEEEDHIRQNPFDSQCHRNRRYFRRSWRLCGQPETLEILERENDPNCEQHTFRGQFCWPEAPYCPHSAFALQFDAHPVPHSVGEYPQRLFEPQHAPFTQGVSELHVPTGKALGLKDFIDERMGSCCGSARAPKAQDKATMCPKRDIDCGFTKREGTWVIKEGVMR